MCRRLPALLPFYTTARGAEGDAFMDVSLVFSLGESLVVERIEHEATTLTVLVVSTSPLRHVSALSGAHLATSTASINGWWPTCPLGGAKSAYACGSSNSGARR
jgi:hypothetical protein